MKYRILFFLLLSGFVVFFSCTAPDDRADLVVLNGNIITVDREFSRAEAVAIKDGVFLAVGDEVDITEYIGEATEVVDAGGKTVIPGLIETHVHATGAARNEAGQPFIQLNNIAEAQEWLRERVKQTPEDEWIRLPRIEVTRIEEGRVPTRAELDEAAPDHPAVFIWQYADLQIQVLNSAAIEAAGITKETKAPPGGRIRLDENGELTGVMENSGSLTEAFLESPDIAEEEYLDHLEQLLQRYNEVGITSIMERGSDAEGYRTYQKLKRADRLPVRVAVTIRLNRGKSAEEAKEYIESLPLAFREGDDRLRTGPLKLIIDGGILYGTAYMREPFGERAQEFYGFEDPDHRGGTFMDRELLTELLRTGHANGWQMSTHVTGDAGVDMVLDAVETVAREQNLGDHRFTLIHAYFPNSETAQRAAGLGVAVDTQPAWYYKDGDALFEVLGEERLHQFIGVQEWKRGGAHVVLNSDHMLGFSPDRSLNPYNPFLTMYAAISRKTEEGRIFNPRQRVSREDALRMMTIDAAWLTYDEDKKGSIEAGKLADLVILSEDILDCEEEKIKRIRSELTMVGGEVVYRSENR